jgi:hypothetical protein
MRLGWERGRTTDREMTHEIGDPTPDLARTSDGTPGLGLQDSDEWSEDVRWVGTHSFNR